MPDIIFCAGSYLDTFEFEKGLSVLKDEMTRLRTAIDHDREYQLSEFADPINVFFDNTCVVIPSLLFAVPVLLLLLLRDHD